MRTYSKRDFVEELELQGANRWVDGPIGMTVEESSGIVAWRPTANQVGRHPALLRVRDDEGAVDLQFFELEVTVPNTAPVITSVPPSPAIVNRPYRYQVQAQDADGDPITFALLNNPIPSGMDLNATTGLLSWNNPTMPGPELFVRATDDHNASTIQTFTLQVKTEAANQPPTVTSAPPNPVVAGLPYQYQVVATDPDSDPITYALDSGEPGMTIDTGTGLFAWTAPAALVGSTVFVQLSVRDGRGPAPRTRSICRSSRVPRTTHPILILHRFPAQRRSIYSIRPNSTPRI